MIVYDHPGVGSVQIRHSCLRSILCRWTPASAGMRKFCVSSVWNLSYLGPGCLDVSFCFSIRAQWSWNFRSSTSRVAGFRANSSFRLSDGKHANCYECNSFCKICPILPPCSHFIIFGRSRRPLWCSICLSIDKCSLTKTFRIISTRTAVVAATFFVWNNTN